MSTSERRGLPKHMVWLIPCLAALTGGTALAIWLSSTRPKDLHMRLPSPTVRPAAQSRKPSVQRNMGTLIPGNGKPSALKASWPQFRGADRTNVAKVDGRLARSWPSEGLRVLWKVDVGEGHAAPAVRNGCVYLIDYDHKKREDAIRCLSLDDGREIWRYTYYVKVKRNHGMSRTIPAVTDKYVVCIGPKCHVHCLDAKTGRLIWKMNMVKQFGTTVPPWYAGQCPLVDGDVVVLAPGGNPLMMAVELATGAVRWRTPNPGGWGMTHSSVVPIDYRGEREYVYCTTQGVVGVAAKNGKLLWKKPDWRIPLANVPSPVAVGSDRIFLSGGYKSGCAMIRLTGEADHIRTEEVFRLKYTVFGADQQTPILYRNHIYGVIPGGELACIDLNGNRLWTSSAAKRFGLGPFLLADGLLFVLNDQHGTLHLVEAVPTEYNELAQAKVLEGHDAWGPMALVADRLLLRDLTQLLCVQVPMEKG